MRTINFQQAEQAVRQSDAPYDARLRQIAERDQAAMVARAERGGAITSAMSEAAQVAYREVLRKRDAARQTLVTPVMAAARAEQIRLRDEALGHAKAFMQSRHALAALERNLQTFTRATEQALPSSYVTYAGGTPHAAEFVARCERYAQAAQQVSARRDARAPLPQVTFADLVAG